MIPWYKDYEGIISYILTFYSNEFKVFDLTCLISLNAIDWENVKGQKGESLFYLPFSLCQGWLNWMVTPYWDTALVIALQVCSINPHFSRNIHQETKHFKETFWALQNSFSKKNTLWSFSEESLSNVKWDTYI